MINVDEEVRRITKMIPGRECRARLISKSLVCAHVHTHTRTHTAVSIFFNLRKQKPKGKGPPRRQLTTYKKVKAFPETLEKLGKSSLTY